MLRPNARRKNLIGLPFGCLFIGLFYIGMPVVPTNGWTYGHVITKISRMGRLPHFLKYGATLARGTPLKLVALEDLEANDHSLAYHSLNF